MGYDNQDSRSVILDLETVPMVGAEAFVDTDVAAPSNYKDPEKIAAYVKDAQDKQIAKAALYPWTARIVALGVWIVGSDAPRVRVMLDDASEVDALKAFWASVGGRTGAVTPLITFNGIGFDLPVLMARSQLLGVSAPVLNIDRYRSPHPDLMQVLTFRGAIQARSLKWFAKRFGVPVDDETSGADVAALVEAGDVQAVADHCESDVRLTYALAARLGLVPAVKSEAAV